MEYDLVIIGAGPAGYVAAERAAGNGLKTALIEKASLGGVCLNEGCIPSKTLLHSAKLYDEARESEQYGVFAENVRYDHTLALKRKNQVVQRLVSGVNAKMRKHGVTVYTGAGKVVNHIGDTFTIDVDGKKLSAGKLLIATGAAPFMPPIDGLKEAVASGLVLTSKEILDIEDPPRDFVVLGGGAIGLEMASYFNSIGSSVTVVEMLDHVGGDIDTEISLLLQKAYEKKGVTFLTSACVSQITSDGLTYRKENAEHELKADKILLAAGRTPIVDSIGLDAAGVEIHEFGIDTDEHMCTNIPNLYAAGDVTGKSMLAHTAYREAEVAVNHMLEKPDRMRYHTVPSVIYTNPEVASVGYTKAAAEERGHQVREVKIPLQYSGRYIAEVENGNGVCKLIVDTRFNRLLGVHLFGSYASEIIYGAALMVETELRIEDLRELVFPHPTVGEAMREALFVF